MKNRKLNIKVTPKYSEFLLEFKTSETLTECVLTLYKENSILIKDSKLYKMPDSYRLIIKGSNTALFLVNIAEFCDRFSNSATETAYTNEYGRELIKSSAIEIFGKAFSKNS